MGRLRLDPRTDDIADQAVNCCRHPRVVARIPPGTSRSRGRTRQDRRVQPVNGALTLPTPTATRSVKAARAREAEKAMEERPHGRQNRPRPFLKLLGMFGKVQPRLAGLWSRDA